MNQRFNLIVIVGAALLMTQLYYQKIYGQIAHQLQEIKIDNQNVRTAVDTMTQEAPAQKDLLRFLEEELSSSLYSLQTEKDQLMSEEKGMPTQHDMSYLLEQMTNEFEDYKIEFISLVPEAIESPESIYNAIRIQLKFKADYPNLIKYVQDLKDKQKYLRIERIEIIVDKEDPSKPMTMMDLVALISHREGEEASELPAPAFKNAEPEQKLVPFGGKAGMALPGEHKLSMVVYRGGVPVAMIDGKVMKVGDVIEGKRIVAIKSDHAIFKDEGGREYTLGINQ